MSLKRDGFWSDWIEWEGTGVCPVPAGTRTEVKFRNEESAIDTIPEFWSWRQKGQGLDIVAYRYLIEDDKEQLEPVLSDACTPDRYADYKHDVSHLKFIDVYRVLERFNVTSHPIGHAIKKCLLSGQRTGNKDMLTDIKEARDALDRWIDMQAEDDV